MAISRSFFKDALIRPAARHCDNILAVGDSVVDEMRFLDADWERAHIDLVYNGVPSYQITLDDKHVSRNRLKQYCANLLGYEPDYVFTHVTRFIPSKGLWRDLRVMEHLDTLLAEQGKSAILFTLSTIIPVGRPAKAILEMARQYGWPVKHRETPIEIDGIEIPDLVSHEIPFYRAIDRFNRSARAAKIVLVNQFGWSRDRCGPQMPEDMSFSDIRQGSDLEFGQSIYEPFGIAQIEPLSFGALCVISSVCGCVGFIRRAGGLDKDNVIVADYVAQAVDQEASHRDGPGHRPNTPQRNRGQASTRRCPSDRGAPAPRRRGSTTTHRGWLCPEPAYELGSGGKRIPDTGTGIGAEH